MLSFLVCNMGPENGIYLSTEGLTYLFGRNLQIKPLLLNTYLRMKALYGMSCAELPVDIARRFQLAIRFHQQHEKNREVSRAEG